MLYSVVIQKDGQVVTEVVERQGTQCTKLQQFVGGYGQILSDEQTGPECDEVHEVEFNNS